MSKLKIGTKVFLKPINNKARSGNIPVQEYEVKSVARKYFEVWQDERETSALKFYIENNSHVTKYSPDWKLYFTMQEIVYLKKNLRAYLNTGLIRMDGNMRDHLLTWINRILRVHGLRWMI
ncbi:hypothetical protein BC351_00790 [Paenibacillus ferrarius]|uniref:Uncharacterized protein n=1 Tax=Paenibacillus ferrarius TaxID=1469647 RepID=A0A1V4HS80_9BACL|nr:hypothetical protein BC351_00790 [Paenibacillus ferrarius]